MSPQLSILKLCRLFAPARCVAGGSREPARRFSGQRGGAFTLVELLVVLAIIALLAALAFPSLRKAMDSAKTAQKIGNLRAIGAAHGTYIAENNGLCLPTNIINDGLNPEIEGNNRAWWCHYLLRYMQNTPKLFLNPQFQPAPGGKAKGTWDDVVNPFTGETVDELPSELRRIQAGFGWNWYRESPGAGDQGDWVTDANVPRPAAAIASPSQQVVCLESLIVVGGPNPSLGITFEGWRAMVVANPAYGLGPRWGGKSIVCLFFDGHVTAMIPQEMNEENFAPLR